MPAELAIRARAGRGGATLTCGAAGAFGILILSSMIVASGLVSGATGAAAIAGTVTGAGAGAAIGGGMLDARFTASWISGTDIIGCHVAPPARPTCAS